MYVCAAATHIQQNAISHAHSWCCLCTPTACCMSCGVGAVRLKNRWVRVAGIALGFTSPCLTPMANDLGLTTVQRSTFASIINLGAVFRSLPSTPLSSLSPIPCSLFLLPPPLSSLRTSPLSSSLFVLPSLHGLPRFARDRKPPPPCLLSEGGCASCMAYWRVQRHRGLLFWAVWHALECEAAGCKASDRL